MGVKVLYSDLDGTMVGPFGCFFRDVAGTPALAPAQALVDLLAAGVELVLVSGRTRPQLEEACRIFGADGYVGELGAVLGWDHARRWTLLRGAMPETYDAPLVDVLDREGLSGRLVEAFAGSLEPHAPWHEGHEADLMLRGHVDVTEVERWLSGQGFPWLRLRDNGVLPGRVTQGGAPVHVYHLMADGLGKGLAVAHDLARRGLHPREAVAAGDSVSDLTMAAHVGRIFLVANGAAAPATRAAAARLDNVTICREANGLGWVEAARWAVEHSATGVPAGGDRRRPGQ